MIQDIYPHIYHNEFQELQPAEHDFVLLFHKNAALLRFQDEKLRFPTFQETKHLPCTFIYLFSIDEKPYFLGLPKSDADSRQVSPDASCSSGQLGKLSSDEAVSFPGYDYHPISIFRTALSRHTAFAGITAHHLFDWYQLNRFCGRCGCQMERDHTERMLRCPSCGSMVYPRISPAVIVAVINDGKILMSKYAGREYTRYALIAGFTEIGETVEETVKREVMEEVGLKVKNLRYYKSQPWAFTDSLLLGFFAELDGDDTITLDRNELSEAGWFSRDEITLEDDHVSLTREMIMLFKRGGIA